VKKSTVTAEERNSWLKRDATKYNVRNT